MTDAEQKIIFANNLLDALRRSGKQQIDVARAIGVSQQTFNTWCRGIALPRIGKIEKLSQFFHVSKSALLDPPAPSTAAASALSPDEQDLLEQYRSLSDEGKGLLSSRADELIRLGYTVEEECKKGENVSA